MNRIYRLVFNRELGVMQVASELVGASQGTANRANRDTQRVLSKLPHALLVALAWLGCASAAHAQDPGSAFIFDGTSTINTPTPYPSGFIVGYQADGFLTVNSGAVVTPYSAMLGHSPGVTGRLDLVGPGTALTSQTNWDSYLRVGFGGGGVLNVLNGARANNFQTLDIAVQAGSNGVATVDGAGSEISVKRIFLGNSGNGQLNVANGAKVLVSQTDSMAPSLRIGFRAGSNGTLNIDGVGSVVDVIGDDAYVGEAGTGTVAITNGARLNALRGIGIGGAAAANGKVQVSGNNSLLSTSGATIGSAGRGDLLVSEGARVEADIARPTGTFLMLGRERGGVGHVTLEGPGSTLDAKGGGFFFGFGLDSEGTLTIRDGALARLGGGRAGSDPGSKGAILVTGEGSRLETGATNRIVIGYQGQGTLDILDGADVSVGNLEIAGHNDVGVDRGPASASGQARVSGAGTTLLVAGELTVADDNRGTLRVDNGASVTAGSLRFERRAPSRPGELGSSTDIAGELVITGAGTTFQTTGNFLASAHFSLTDGAQLTTGSAQLASNAVTLPTHAALVSGAGTVWNNAGLLALNTPTNILDGATVNTGTLELGPSRWVNSATPPVLLAQLRVAGTGSRLVTAGALDLGTTRVPGDATSYVVLSEGGHLEAGGDINLRAGGGLALGAGLTLDSNRLPTYAPALAAGTFNPGARLVFTTTAGADKLLLNHTSDDLVLTNTLLSADYARNERPGEGITAVAGTTRLTGDLSQYASGIDVHGGKLVLESNVNAKPAAYDPAAETTYVQLFEVKGGALIINGTAGFAYDYSGRRYGTTSVQVTGQGVLGGRGTIVGSGGNGALYQAVEAYDGGRIAPGDASAATLTIDGDLHFGRVGHQGSTAFYDVDVRGDGSSDKLVVSGRAVLNEGGGTASVTVNPLDPGTSYQDGQTYTILTAAGGVTGTFAGVSSQSAFLTPTLTYDANNVMLRLGLIASALPYVVRNGQTLTGDGTYAGIEVQGGGTVSPGTSASPVATISATAPVTFAAGSFFDVDVRGDGSSDKLTTTASATLSGGTVRVTALDPRASYQDGQQYTILSAAGGLSGTFADALSRSAFLVPTLSYDANNAMLRIALVTESTDGVVRDGQVLSGNGSYSRIEVQSGGTVSPGTSAAPVGQIQATGPVSFAAGSFFDVDIKGDGTSDRLTTTGAATLSGGTVRVTALDPQASYQNGQRYTILSAAGGLTGTFANALSRSAFLTPSLSYTGSDAQLTIALGGSGTPGPTPGAPLVFQTVAETRNQYNMAMALNTLPQQGQALALYNRLLFLSADEARDAFGSLSGELHGAARTGMLDDRFVRDGVDHRFTGSVSGESSDGVSAWIDGSAIGSTIDGDGNGQRASGQRSGVLAGVDWALGDRLTVGVAAGVEDIDRRVRAWHSSADINARHLGIYANGDFGAFSLRGGASHAWFEVDTLRHAVIGAGAPDRLTSNYDAKATTFFAEGAWNLELGNASVAPYLAVAHTRLRTDGSTEQGAATALHVAASKDELLTATLGVRAGWELDGGTRLTAGLGWQNANGELKQEHRAALVAGGDAFTVYGAPLGRNTGIAELGLHLPLTDASRVQLGLQGRFGDGQSDAGGHVNWVWNF